MRNSFLFVSLILFFASCENKEPITKDDILDSDQLIAAIFDIQSEGSAEAFEVKIKADFDSDAFQIENVEKIDPFFSWIDVPNNGRTEGDWQVCCDDSWCENCDGVRSCGQLVKRCLNGDGCATICEINAIWIPDTKELMLNPK